MKKIIGVILAMAIFTPFALWALTPTRLPNGLSIATETQEASTGPTMSAGDLYVVGNTKMTGTLSTIGLQTATGGVTIPSGATLTLASGSTLVSTGMVVMQNITGALGLTVTNHVTASSFTATSGSYSYQGLNGIDIYEAVISSTIGGGGSVTLAKADGKAGSFSVICGTTSAIGSFTSAAAVTLTTLSSPATSTTASTAASINISDGGTVVLVTQNAFTSAVVYIRYNWVP